ncbi:helix-turn-helix domain-containing protein [Candidatus Omnitrophota bacterium]
MENKEYMSIAEVAKILGLTRQAIYKQVKKGQIDAIKIGKSYAIPASKLLTKLRKNLNDKDKEQISAIIKRVVKEYGQTLKLLGDE